MSDDQEKRQLEKLLQNEDKGVGNAQNELARLFREVLSDLNVTPGVWNRQMKQYLDDPRNRVPRTSRGRSSTRGNTMKELIKDRMTWNNLAKGIKMMNPVQAKLSLELTWRSGHKTRHEIMMMDQGQSQFQDQDQDDSDS